MFGVEGETKESFLKKSGKGNTFQFFFFTQKICKNGFCTNGIEWKIISSWLMREFLFIFE